MKLSNTAKMELSARYRHILEKCFILNTAVLISFTGTTTVNAAYPDVDGTTETLSGVLAENETTTSPVVKVINGGTLNLENASATNVVYNSSYAKGNIFFGDEFVKDGDVFKTAIINVKDSSFVGNTNNNGRGGVGAIDDAGTLTISGNTTFKDSSAIFGGALYTSGNMTIDGGADNYVLFQGNTTTVQLTEEQIKNDKLNVNDYRGAANISEEGGGAVFIGQNAKTVIKKAKFIGNQTDAYGGAIAMRHLMHGSVFDYTGQPDKAIRGDEGSLNIEDSIFDGNTSKFRGGAIYNTYYEAKGSEASSTGNYKGPVTVSGTQFMNNTADEGGAIFNDGRGLLAFPLTGSSPAAIEFTDSEFTGNVATTAGGAIYNNHFDELILSYTYVYEDQTTEDRTNTVKMTDADGRPLGEGIILSGNNIFRGNKAGGVGNDIHNLGNTTIKNGVTTMDGGVTGDTGWFLVQKGARLNLEGNATIRQENITFEDGSVLGVTLKKDTPLLYAQDITFGKMEVKIASPVMGEYTLAEATNSVTDNGLTANDEASLYAYEASIKNNRLIITGDVKKSDDIAEDLGVSDKTAEIIAGVAGLASGNQVASEIVTNMQSLAAGGNTAALEDAADALLPSTGAVAQSLSTSLNKEIYSAVDSHMSPRSFGRTGGDWSDVSVGPWVKALYNRAKQDKNGSDNGFHGYTRGIALGSDITVNDDFTVGIGYAYNNSDVKSINRKTDVNGHTGFIYGKYQPNAWWVNAVASYGVGSYDEKANVAGVTVKSDYDVDTIGAQVMTGYDFVNNNFNSILTPKAGIRYTHIKQDDYTSSAGVMTHADKNDVLTAIVGAEFAQLIDTKDWLFEPNIRVAAVYDIVSDGSQAVVSVGNSIFTNQGKRLPRFGVEAGVGVNFTVADSIDVSFDYDAEVRRDYVNHTGSVSLQYNF